MAVKHIAQGVYDAIQDAVDEWLLEKMDTKRFSGKIIKNYLAAKYSEPSKAETLEGQIKEKKLQNELDCLNYSNAKRTNRLNALEDLRKSLAEFIGKPKV